MYRFRLPTVGQRQRLEFSILPIARGKVTADRNATQILTLNQTRRIPMCIRIHGASARPGTSPLAFGNCFAGHYGQFLYDDGIPVVHLSDRFRNFVQGSGEMYRLTDVRYKADITAGALKLPESRIIAGLLLRKVDAEGWKDAIVTKNVLQARNLSTARRLTKLIRGRLETMGPDLWKLVRDGKGTVAVHAVFAAAVKHSPLLGDFLDLVVGEQYRMFGTALTHTMFADYLEGCRERDADMPQWNESTQRRLRSSVFQMLAQAGYVENTRSLKLQTVHIADQVLRYLKANKQEYVLRCIQVAP